MYENRYNFWKDNKGKLSKIDVKFGTSYRDFEDYYFTKLEDLKLFYEVNRDLYGYSDTLDNFIKIFACDLVNDSVDKTVWGNAVEFCKVPEPPKKSTPIEIIQKYSDQAIFPFTKGKMVTNADGINGYYEKEGKHQGRDGIFIIQAPNKEGVANYGFSIDGENVFNGVYKIQNVIHESKRKKKNISERFDRDLKVLYLLKEVSRINKTKKKIVFEQETTPAPTGAAATKGQVKQEELLSDTQAKDEFNKKLAKYFSTTFDFMDEPQMRDYTNQIINVLKKGYKGVIFGAFRRALYLASITIPGASGEDNQVRQKTELFKDMLAELNGITDKTLFSNPTSDELEEGKYEIIEPTRLDAWIKSLMNPELLKTGAYGGGVYRPTTLNTFRSKPVTMEECQNELKNIYNEASSFTETYCKSQKYQDRKQYIFSCKGKNYFEVKRPGLTANVNRLDKFYSELYSGININVACAFKKQK